MFGAGGEPAGVSVTMPVLTPLILLSSRSASGQITSLALVIYFFKFRMRWAVLAPSPLPSPLSLVVARSS